MTPVADEWLILCFLVFCRVGACLMVFPGWGSARIPARIRLFLALGASLALLPASADAVRPLIANVGSPVQLWLAIGSEVATGLTIGLAGRIFVLALQFAGIFISNMLGFGMGGASIEELDSSTGLADLMTLTATALFFMLELHGELLRALLESYQFWPPASMFSPTMSLDTLVKVVQETFRRALQVSAPFIFYTIGVNFALGLLNRLLPQIPVQFVAGPLVIYGGIGILLVVFQPMQMVYLQAFDAWLKRG